MGINIRNQAIPEVTINPSNPAVGQRWIRVDGQVGNAGQAMGVMGLTYTHQEANTWTLCVQTSEQSVKTVPLI